MFYPPKFISKEVEIIPINQSPSPPGFTSHVNLCVYVCMCGVWRSALGILPPKLSTLLFETAFLMETWKRSDLARTAIHQSPESPLPLPPLYWHLPALPRLQLHLLPGSLFVSMDLLGKKALSNYSLYVERTLPTAMGTVVLINIPRSGTVKCAFSPFLLSIVLLY